MDKLIGLAFCGIATFLYTSAHSTAAAHAQTITSWNHPTGDKWGTRFQMALEQTAGEPLMLWAKIALVLGILFLAKGVWADFKKRKAVD